MHTFIIAEAGSNHDGELYRAKKLIDIAIYAGCDAVKFQLIPPFKEEWIDLLMEYCGDRIEFMATPFNQKGIDALKGKVKHWKIASTEAADGNFVQSVVVAANGQKIFMSDGALPPDEESRMHNIFLLVCVVEYPAKPEDYHFLSGVWGISDHTESPTFPSLAVAAGATVVEKHFTDDRKRDGPDHCYALDPLDLKLMVDEIRLTEKILNNKKKTITTYVGRKLKW